MKLDNEDILNLMDALDAWENKDLSMELMTGVMGALFLDKKDPEAQIQFKKDRENEKRVYEFAQRERKEKSVLLKAKLITIRKQLEAEQIETLGTNANT